MKFPSPPSESQPRPSVVDLRARPHKAVDVLQATETEPVSDLMFDPKVDISPASEKAMFDKLNEERNNNWWLFSNMAKRLSILYPDRKADLELGESEFNEMKAELNVYRNKNWWNFSDMSMRLSILSAERAQITTDGQIRLTYKPKPLVKARKPLPTVSRIQVRE